MQHTSRGKGRTPCSGTGSSACLKPQVVLGLVSYFALVVRDVTSANDAVHGPLVGVRVVPQGPAVMQSELVFRGWRQPKDTRAHTETHTH